METNIFLVFAAAFAAAIHPTNAQLIVNGGFETPDTPVYLHISAGQNTIAPWVVGLHSVEVLDGAGTTLITGPAFEGGQFLDLTGTGRGRITQALATTPGSLYTLTFAYTDNYYEPSTSGSASARVRIFDGLGDRLNQTITHTGAVAGNYHWTVFNEQFTAVTNRTSLEFTSLSNSAGGHSGGIMLDAVHVSEGTSLKILSITRVGNGPVVLEVLGFPNGVHRIQASVDLSVGSFIDIATVTADAAGLLEFQDTRSGLTKSFYRVVFHPKPADWGPAVSIDPGGRNNINTSAMEGCPIESPDGRSLFFASNRAGGQGGIDIWMARRDGLDEPWRDPVNLPPLVNSAFDDFCPTPLPDGGLFFVSRRPNGCSENSADIYFHPNPGLLGSVILNCEVNSAGDEFSPSYVPAGGGTLFFSSNRDGTHKIYASAGQPGGFFGEPVEVTELNAPGFNTFRPNVSENGLEIVFDSDRPGGLGGPDVWSATRASASDTWRAPVNLGPNVNSDLAETRASLSKDGKRLTLGSTRPGGQGSGDIYVSTR